MPRYRVVVDNSVDGEPPTKGGDESVEAATAEAARAQALAANDWATRVVDTFVAE